VVKFRENLSWLARRLPFLLKWFNYGLKLMYVIKGISEYKTLLGSAEDKKGVSRSKCYKISSYEEDL
jgi:hypothetical protein